MAERLFFMIEGGKALELVKQHIVDRRRAEDDARALGRELGAESIRVGDSDGRILSVMFAGTPPTDFTRPDKHGCRPKKGTHWAKRFAEQKGYESPSAVIHEALAIPFEIAYSDKNGTGFRRIGDPLQECGFLYLGQDGPYAMWIPDVHAEVAFDLSRGRAVAEPARSFKVQFDGCRKIDIEEWELLVAQHRFQKAQARKAA
jgi:hypothetical protein